MKLIILAVAISLIIGLGNAFPHGLMEITYRSAKAGWDVSAQTINVDRLPISSRRRLPKVGVR